MAYCHHTVVNMMINPWIWEIWRYEQIAARNQHFGLQLHKYMFWILQLRLGSSLWVVCFGKS